MDSPSALLATRGGAVWVIGAHRNFAATSKFDGTSWSLKVHPTVSRGLHPGGALEARDGSVWFGAVSADPEAGFLGGILQFTGREWIHHYPFPPVRI
jgi:hypothetical protein